MEDIDQEDVNQIAEEEVSDSDSSTEETKATEDGEDVEFDATADNDTESTETGGSSKKGANSRIRELNSQKKAAEQRASSLETKLAELTGSVEPKVPQAPYTPQIREGEELDLEQYKQDVLKTADSLVTLKVKQSEAVNRINNEAVDVLGTYPQLDPDSDFFDEELSDSVTEATLAHVQSSPYTASPKKFVDRMMKPYLRSVTKEVGKERENLAKQVSQSATKPTSISTKGGKSDSEKSIEELESELGFHY